MTKQIHVPVDATTVWTWVSLSIGKASISIIIIVIFLIIILIIPCVSGGRATFSWPGLRSRLRMHLSVTQDLVMSSRQNIVLFDKERDLLV